jgi:hypothetical protein
VRLVGYLNRKAVGISWKTASQKQQKKAAVLTGGHVVELSRL